MDAFAVTVDHEEMIVSMKAGLKLPGTITSKKELSELLRENNVFKGVDKDEINRAFEELPGLKEEKIFIVAQGKPPVNGIDGRLEFHVNVSGKAEYSAGDNVDGQRVDYKNAVSVESVVAGTRLLTVVPPTLGVDGYNLSGKPLAAKNGREINVVLSEGTEFNADRTEVIATSQGRPVFSHGIFSVRSVYDVSGDVCYETGNIKFNGHVHIFGGVQDEFSVEADSVEINGIVGSADIKCKGDMIVSGGINGRGKSNIICGGNAEIKYINSAKIEVKGNLTVQKEMVNSEVKCNGRIVSKKIIGGESYALKGVEVVQAGSEVGTPTVIVSGHNYEIERIENAMEVLSAQIDAAIKPIKNNLGEREFFKKLDTAKKDSVVKSYAYFKRLKSAYERLINGREAIMKNDEFTPVKEVVILKRMYQDVFIKTRLCSKNFMVEVGGPIKLIEDINNSSIKKISYTQSAEEEIMSKEVD